MGAAIQTPSSSSGATVAPMWVQAAAMRSPPHASSQVWGKFRAAQMSRNARIGCKPPSAVTFIPKPSTRPVPATVIAVFMLVQLSSMYIAWLICERIFWKSSMVLQGCSRMKGTCAHSRQSLKASRVFRPRFASTASLIRELPTASHTF
ncbi:hypothetical protein D3C76_1121680 [compost metagenome]